MDKLKKDIFGKEIETLYVSSAGKKVFENLQKQMTAMYLFLERKGLLNDEEFKDFADSRELAESIEKLNQPEEKRLPQSNSLSYIIHNEENTEYCSGTTTNNTYVGSDCSRMRFIKDELTGRLYDLDDTDEVVKLLEDINKRLK